MTFAVASRWRSDCESISQCTRVQGGTVMECDQSMHTKVITVCSLVSKVRTSWLRHGHSLWLLEELVLTFNCWGLANNLSEFCRNWLNGVGGFHWNTYARNIVYSSVQKRVFHKILNGRIFFQTAISSPEGNSVEHTCPHICVKFYIIWSYGVCCTA